MGHEFEEFFHIEMLSKVLERNNKMYSYESWGSFSQELQT